MNKLKSEIKLSFIVGLEEIVLNEISTIKKIHFFDKGEDFLYFAFDGDLSSIKKLRSVSKAFVVIRNAKYTPLFLSNHKSILGNLIEIVINKNKNLFKSFKLICAGSGSPEVRAIAAYINTTYGLIEAEDADLKLHIIKNKDIWEVGIQITPRPLSSREYKVKNMGGAMDPTLAYSLNSLCNLNKADSYLNVFSGSGTLLIEAGQCYPNLKKLVGFDIDKEHVSLAIQNIKKAGLIKRIELKVKDIFDDPDLGKFDVITSDLPFGMTISKNEDLESLYRQFVKYAEKKLNQNGRLVVYTNEHELLKSIIKESSFDIVKTIELKFITGANAYIYPKIFVCKLNNQ